MMPEYGRCIEIRGTVQGVGFRPWVYRLAREVGLTGRVSNDETGVRIEVYGTEQALDRFLARLKTQPPPAAVIDRVTWESVAPEELQEFIIVPSRESEERRVTIPPDLATCDECLQEIRTPADRRYRYPFTNCTNCGPRFTIVRDIPYDRSRTTMASFTMCPQCQREYESVEDRRFHAQPNACPVCGPRLALLGADGRPLDAVDPLVSAAIALKEGLTVAVKGLGGFHLTCDATSSQAIQRLRVRKKRDQKPFAVMVRDLEEAARLTHVSPQEERLLTSVQRPIVLLRRRESCTLAREIAPGSPYAGLMLPYTPMHHLLLAEAERPLVMTSGNLSEEPIAYLNMEAVERLGDMADFFLVHDREIETRCDDSVVRVIAEQPVLLRRSRGYVPRGIAVTKPFLRPVLACGAHLKNTFCLGIGDTAYLGPHIGDLENLETYESYQASIERMERFLQVSPEVIAHDLHPDYLSTTYARSRSGLLAIGVQHHHAHVASVMGEHGIEGPVIGVAYDGTGYGTDATAWGGELLIATFEKYKRVATFRGLPLAGGDQAIHQVWRIALALLDDAFDGNPPLSRLRLFELVDRRDVAVVRQMIKQRLNSPLARGVGRYFDGYGALLLEHLESAFEGQVAMALENTANLDDTGRYRYSIDFESTPWAVDPRPLTRDLVTDLLAGRSPGVIASRFHNTLIAVTVELVRSVRARYGAAPVVLTGGCFQNAYLTEGLQSKLVPEFSLYRHSQVPPGDGGLSLGQVLVADAMVRKNG